MLLISKVTQQQIVLLLNKPWFLPSLICLLLNAIGILSAISIDHFAIVKSFAISTDKQQTILGIMATALMTLIGVTFSISMLILSTVSNQFGPRLLPNFIQSKSTQITLGVFLATFVFCLFSIYYDTNESMRGAQTIYAFILTIACLTVLVFFINKVMQSIQIDEILALVVAETKSTIDSAFEKMTDHHACDEQTLDAPYLIESIHSTLNGYIQGIDYVKLNLIAQRNDLFIELLVRPGEYIYRNNILMNIYVQQQRKLEPMIISKLERIISIISVRMSNQDVEYGFEQISEIAVRALSPGINDPYTARNCLFLLGELFLYMDQFSNIECNHLGSDNKVYVIYKPFTYLSLLDAALSRLRQAALSDIMVVLSFYDMIIQVVKLLKNKMLIACLIDQGCALRQLIVSKQFSTHDEKAIAERENTLLHLAEEYQIKNLPN